MTRIGRSDFAIYASSIRDRQTDVSGAGAFDAYLPRGANTTADVLDHENDSALCRVGAERVALADLILGACNPSLARQALDEEPDLGLLLPCNVVIYECEGRVVVSAIDADKMLSIVGNPRLEIVAKRINEKLRQVIDSI